MGMDVECATMPTATPPKEGQQCLQHFSHPHPLSLVDNKDDVKCFACESNFSGPAYGCSHCNYFLHKCAEFPKEVRHPFHPRHGGLFLDYKDRRYVETCDICETTSETSCWNFTFKCYECSFRLCWKCNVSVRRTIEYEDHEHDICFVEKTGNKEKKLGRCNVYDGYCARPELISDGVVIPEEFKRTASSIFKCMNCPDFRLHLLCGPLPSTIKHKCHIRALNLLDSLMDDEPGEHYCDVCETERDPRIRLYYCKDCKYSAHVHCVISEIMNVLKGDLKGVELMVLGKDTWSHAVRDNKRKYQPTSLTLSCLIHKVNANDRQLLQQHYKWNDTSSKGTNQQQQPKEEEEEEISETLRLSHFTDQEFIRFCTDLEDRFKSGEKLELKPRELALKLVKFRGYLIPYSLIDVLATLLDNHRDLVAISLHWMSVEMKSFLLSILCLVEKRMRSTLVKDVTKNLLREWYFHLRFATERGLKAGFALAQFESLVDAFLGLQAPRLGDEILRMLKAKMAEIQQGLDKCDEYYRGSSRRSEYMKYCLKKGSESTWHTAFEIDGGDRSRSAPRPRWRWPKPNWI